MPLQFGQDLITLESITKEARLVSAFFLKKSLENPSKTIEKGNLSNIRHGNPHKNPDLLMNAGDFL